MDFLLPESKKRKLEKALEGHVLGSGGIVDGSSIGNGGTLREYDPNQPQHIATDRGDADHKDQKDGTSHVASSRQVHIVTPGEVICKSDAGFMRGHGTYVDEENLMASVAGVVERVNRLISVKPLQSRYTGEIGDVIVCRILEVSQKRWKVDTNSRQDSILMLSAVNLPGVQRRKSEADELQMRNFYAEGDVLSAEVQAFFGDGSMAIHTRSLKYGKLFNGTFLSVPPALIKRCKSHFHVLPCGVAVILGLNGYIWVSQPVPERKNEDEEEGANIEPVSLGMRETIARVCNTIMALRQQFMYIYDTSIIFCYEASLAFPVKDLLKREAIEQITSETRNRLEMLDD